MMKSNIVSILVPIYNTPHKMLEKCITSLVNQTYTNIEIVIVDDGSTDVKCETICREFANQDSRIIYIKQKNQGLASARNKAFDCSRGQWVTFVDGDDYVSLDMCENLIDIAVQENVDLILFNKILEKDNKQYKKIWKSDSLLKIYDDKRTEMINQCLNYQSGIATAYCKFLKKSFLVKNQLRHDDSLKQGLEGVEFSLQVYQKYNKMIYLNKCLYYYQYGNSNSCSKNVNLDFVDNIYRGLKKIQYDLNYLFESDEQMNNFWNRVNYTRIANSINGLFGYYCNDSYMTRVKIFKEIQCRDIFKEANNHLNYDSFSCSRKIVLFFVAHRIYFGLELIASLKYLINKVKK